MTSRPSRILALKTTAWRKPTGARTPWRVGPVYHPVAASELLAMRVAILSLLIVCAVLLRMVAQ
jgi:hypothetical protein